MNKRFKKFIAIVSAIAMVVSSITVYNANNVKAAAPVAVDGMIYTVTDGATDIVGFTCQGIFDSARIHFAWGTALVVDTMTVTVDGNPVAVDGKSTNGMFIPLTEVSSLGAGEYQIVVTGEDSNNPGTVLTGNATLKIEEEGETTTRDPSVVNWVDLGEGFSYDDNTTASIVNIQQPGFAAEKGIYMTVAGGISSVAVNGDTANGSAVQGAGAVVYLSALALKTNEIVITYAGGTATVKVANANGVDASETTKPVETTPAETTPAETTTPSGEEFDPSTITDWTAVTNSTTLSYYIADGKADKVSVKPEMHTDDFYAAFALAAKFSSVTLNDVALEPDGGAQVIIPKTSFKEGYNKLKVVDFYGNETVTIYVKADKEPETTTAAPVADGEEILKNVEFNGADNWNEAQIKEPVNNGDGSIDFKVDAVTGGNTYDYQLVQNGITLENAKWYVAKYTVTSDVDKNFRLLVQSDANAGGDWSEFAGLVTSVKAGQTVEVTLKFQANKAANANALMAILMGYIDGTASEAANVKVSAVSLKGYTNEPDVTTGSVVVDEPSVTTKTVTVDGTKVADVEAGATYTLPTTAEYGYYADGVMYRPGATVTVNSDIAFTSVNTLSVTAEQGAGIRLLNDDKGAGIRFQATVTSDNMEAVKSTVITEGMLITANDLYETLGNSELFLNSQYTFKNIPNDGTWYNGQTGTYCGSIVKIAESNYIRNFIAKAYVIITYSDGGKKAVYSEMTGARSIKYVATAIKNAGYPNIADADKVLVDKFAAAK